MAELAEAGCVAFSDDGQCVMNAEIYRRAMEYALPFGVPIISHAEDEHLAHSGAMHEGLVSTELGLLGQPWVAEDVMVARDILLAELTGAHVHIAHISTAGAVRLVREGKARGVRVTAEVTPHHLVLTDEAVREYDPNTKMAPPLRTKRDVEAVLEGLLDGTIDCIATDHAPHALSEKEGEFGECANGVVGLETAVPLLLDRLVRAGRMDLPTLVAAALPGPRAAAEPARRQPRPGRARRHHRARPRARVDGRAGALPLARAQHALRRLHGHGRARDDHRRRQGGDDMTAGAPRARRRPRLQGPGLRRRGRGPRRGGLQHLHDGLPGDHDRPVLPRSARLHDLSAHRQLRDQRRKTSSRGGRGSTASSSRRPARYPSSWRGRVADPGLHARARHRRHPGHRHARAHAPPARPRRPGGHHLDRRDRCGARSSSGRGRCRAWSAATS